MRFILFRENEYGTIEHPEIYQLFPSGHFVIIFVVKMNTISFNGFAPDMKLEQTIQRSGKSYGGMLLHNGNYK